jgi:hypothetical protein
MINYIAWKALFAEDTGCMNCHMFEISRILASCGIDDLDGQLLNSADLAKFIKLQKTDYVGTPKLNRKNAIKSKREKNKER